MKKYAKHFDAKFDVESSQTLDIFKPNNVKK